MRLRFRCVSCHVPCLTPLLHRYWTWLGPKESLVFFGVPLQNFIGWFLTALVIAGVIRSLRFVCSSCEAPPASRSSSWYASIPVLYYLGEAVYTAVGAVTPFDTRLPQPQRQALGLIVMSTSVAWSAFALGQMLTAGGAAKAKLA